MKGKVICFPFIGDSRGGSYVSSAILIKELRNRGHHVKVIAHQRGPLTLYFEKIGVDYILLPLLWAETVQHSGLMISFRNLLQNIWPLYRFLKRNHVSIVHTNDARINILWSLPCSLARIKHIWHQRTRFAPSRMTSFYLRFSSCVICISDFVANSLPADFTGLSVVIPNAVLPTLPSDADRVRCRKSMVEQAGLSSECRIVGSFGTLRDLKKPDIFAEAVANLSSIYQHPIIAVVFGEDRESWQPRMLSILNSDEQRDRMLFMGFVDDIYPWMAACDLVTSTSTDDGFGRTLIEAMHLGVPVVAAAAGGHTEVISHNETGCLVRPDDPNDTAQAMLKLLSDDDFRHHIIKTARIIAYNNFSATSHCDAVENVYTQVLGTALS